jgi:undecaprenyl-diphosphatase
VYDRPRPFVALPDIHPLIATLPSENLQSFPSGHALFFFAIATVLFCFNKRVGVLAFIAAAVMAIARVYVGVHWPSDILGGAVIGMLTGWLAYAWYARASARGSFRPW